MHKNRVQHIESLKDLVKRLVLMQQSDYPEFGYHFSNAIIEIHLEILRLEKDRQLEPTVKTEGFSNYNHLVFHKNRMEEVIEDMMSKVIDTESVDGWNDAIDHLNEDLSGIITDLNAQAKGT